MKLYKYQEKVARLLREGKNIILQAPTGCGKNLAALWPFLERWSRNLPDTFPRQCIYTVPMRVLANQFVDTARELIQQELRLPYEPSIAIQTGPRSEDQKFEADLIFTTIDQALSSFLSIPYSLSNRQANLNAGAIIGSYLVFDEFHLFPVDEHGDGALATTLHMLKMLKGITPFVLMTATFSETMIKRLCSELSAEAVILTQDEIDAIPSQQGKQRRYCYRAQELMPEAVIQDLLQHRRNRVIAICNMVDRAQDLSEVLRNDDRLAGIQVELLHSRFYSSDRNVKEERIRREFGGDRSRYTQTPMILVATQVVEVGLNITCDVLHTEMAPAAAIIQRGGRCARFEGEKGLVLVYDVPLNDAGQPNYAPYLDTHQGSAGELLEGQSKLCLRTQAAFATFPPEGKVLNYHGELELVDIAHTPFDDVLLNMLHNNRHDLRAAVEAVLHKHDRTAARHLIRDIDNRTLIIHPDLNEATVPNPYRYEGIGIRRGALLKWFSNPDLHDYANTRELDWIARIAIPQETDYDSEDAEQRRRIETHWLTLAPSTDKKQIRAMCNELAGAGLIAVHPALVQYDTVSGLRMTTGTPATYSPIDTRRRTQDNFGPLHRETYAEHIAGLQRVYTRELRDRTAAVRYRFEQRLGLEVGTLDRAIRLMFAVHDLGKLDQVWQTWAHNWQARVSKSDLRDQDRSISDEYMAAHTDYDSSDSAERLANKSIRPKRPHHAAESARAGRALISAVSPCEALRVGLMTAILCHHSSSVRTDHGPFTPAGKAARDAFSAAMRAVRLFDDQVLRGSGAKVAWEGFAAEEGLSEDIIDVARTDEVVLYLFLVRVLRLADQKSQES